MVPTGLDLRNLDQNTIAAACWEHGSHFHWFGGGTSEASGTWPWGTRGWLGGSGRDALRALVGHGKRTRGWKRLWCPAYYCWDVVESLRRCDIEVLFYADAPRRPEPVLPMDRLTGGDVCLLVNYFGLRGTPACLPALPDGVESIEDHSHDPESGWAAGSAADWCFASLRKMLPLPDGGVIWSPRGHTLPAPLPVTRDRHAASSEKLAAMTLKALYLKGSPIEKQVFRTLGLNGEKHIAAGAPYGMTPWSAALLRAFPRPDWRAQQKMNHQVLCETLDGTPGISVLRPMTDGDACLFSVVLCFPDRALRDAVRKEMTDRKVYASVLWEIPQTGRQVLAPEDRDFHERMLSVYCDMRYSVEDMRQAGRIIAAACTRAHEVLRTPSIR